MSDILKDPAAIKRRKAAVEAFLGSLVKGAKTVTLYKEGHAIIGQVIERVLTLLKTAIGPEPNLPLEIKAKQVLFEDEPLAEGSEAAAFAASLHTLGIGQVLFTPQLTADGMFGLMKLLVWKADEKTSLTDKQRELQGLRIDGLQLVSILSFVVTGEEEADDQPPGELSEEQIQAFTKASTLPDYLQLLLRQNEKLSGKGAENVTTLLDQVLNRDISAERFAREMPWSSYDPRIRARFDWFMGGLRDRTKWTREPLSAATTVFGDADIEALKKHQIHEADDAFRFSLDQIHEILAHPAGEQQPKFALYAYSRLLEDLGRMGELKLLLREFHLWHQLAADPKWASYLAVLREHVQSRVPSAALAACIADGLGGLDEDSEAFTELQDFILTLGRSMTPHLMEELRRVQDKAARKKYCTLMARLCSRLGPEPVLQALKDEDYFQAVQAVGILDEMRFKGIVEHIAPLLKHKHAKVRQTVARTLGRIGGRDSVETLAEFIGSGEHPDEAKIAATTISLIQEPNVAEKLIEAYSKNDDYGTRGAIVTVLGRLPGEKTRVFLRETSKRDWRDWFNVWREWFLGEKDLKALARAALKQVEEGLKSHGSQGT